MTIDPTPIIVSVVGFLGVLVTQAVTYVKQKQDRIRGTADAAAKKARDDQKLMDRLDAMDRKLDLHNEKLDKHNGFEGRIIALEIAAEWMQRDLEKEE